MLTPAARHFALAFLCSAFAAIAAPREEVVFSFAPPPLAPLGEAAQGADGTIYATTSAGGGPGFGSIFKVGADKIPQTLVEFTGTSGAHKGAQPAGGLVFGDDGRLYGTTARGGQNDLGTIFSVTTDGTFVTLVEFDGANIYPGAAPYAAMVKGSDGTLYGTTSRGGQNDAGTVFQFNPADGSYIVLVEFTGAKGFAKGAAPFGAVTFGSDGKLYGTTSHGGAADHGTVFSYDLINGIFKSLLEFSDNGATNKGTAPYGGLVRASNDRLYGTTARGGAADQGTIFSVSNTGALTTLVQFTGSSGANRGALPEATLARGMNGNLYGTTYGGGKNGAGTVFEVTLAGKLTTLVDFTRTAGAAPGANPQAGLILGNNGSFYGTTFAGGAGNAGTVFKMGQAGEFESVCALPGVSLATYSQPGVIPGPQQSFFGVTKLNGAPGKGTAFRILYTGEYTTLAEFTGTGGPTKGDSPSAPLLFAAGNFFGTTAKGGAGDFGTIFKLQTDGTLTTLIEFSGTSGNALGATPRAALISDGNGAFLGTTAEGGAANFGTIFKMTPLGDFTSLVEFSGNGATNKGGMPQSALIRGNDGKYYGVTTRGGGSDLGTVYQLDLSGQTPVLTTLVEFNDTDVPGAFPAGPLALGTNGSLFGPTATGGATGNGTLFQYGAAFASLLDFSDHRATNKGAFPRGPLALVSDGNFYGTTGFGGTRGLGTIFKYSPAAPFTITTLAELAYGGANKDGAYPETGFVEGTDGNLYATSSAGGDHGAGTVFRLRLRALTLSLEAGFVQNDGARLRARIQAGALPAMVSFEYGDTDAYGQSTAAQQVGTGTTDSFLTASLTGLLPNTVYHYRVTITDSTGTVVGKDQTFTTEPLATQVIAAGNGIANEDVAITAKDFGTPAIADGGVIAVAANLNTATGALPVILAGSPPTVLVRKGDPAPIPGNSSATFTSFGDPVIDANLNVAFTAKAGTTTGLFTNATGTLATPAFVGGPVPDVSGAKFTAISSFALSDSGALFYVATIAGGGATTATNQGIWVSDGATNKLLLRRNDPVADSKIASITALSPVANSTGQGRGYYDKMLIARVTLLNGAQALVRLTPATAPDVTGPTPLFLATHPPFPVVQKMGVPSVTAAGGIAFLGTLAGPKPAIVASNPTSVDNPNLLILTRAGLQNTGIDGVAFASLGDPVYNAQYVAAFPATVSGFGITAANNAGLWFTGPSDLQPLARRGDEPPGVPGAVFDTFTSLALPDNAGPIFLAKIAPAKNTSIPPDVTAANNIGLWGLDSTGVLRLLVRAGDALKIDGASKTLSLLTVLNSVPGSPGQARSYNSTRDVTFRATFTDHTQAIMSLHLP